eukprot:CAMPEP_0113938838 /NCGR_PEP_ID=MMETSP1339-20121228/5253_1 /TAXON_ID=94617 /ORGANISM="Fibrocapsa japonica" /LENGTH=208 /DNA_ID=CAMNT_0000942129 /DNA_START=141 /DNA_END=767 /DNA_ORIENTATION=+ /assembly_acc=CAM_ASM_000762
MGDSITEGTLIEWKRQVGEVVEADSVVAVIETDKVSVDIRSPSPGVITKQMCGVDETVVVGADLLELDTEASVSASFPAPTAVQQEEGSLPIEQAEKAATSAQDAKPQPLAIRKRVPLIKFRGKRPRPGQHQHLEPPAPPAPPAPQQQSTPPAPVIPTSDAPAARAEESDEGIKYIDYLEIPEGARFGRPEVSEEEMEAVNLGGMIPN